MSSDTHFVSICAVRRRQQAVAEKCDGHSTARHDTVTYIRLNPFIRRMRGRRARGQTETDLQRLL